jgi:hypothetical protein
MKISDLIARLEEVHYQFGDLDVVIAEVSTIHRERYDVVVEDSACIIQTYTIIQGHLDA